MATTYTRNLKLRINSNLTADAKYNLERIDTIGGSFLVDSTDTLSIRSKTDIVIEPESPDVDGSGVGGSVFYGNADHHLDLVEFLADEVSLSSALSLLDQATSGNSYLNLEYKSDISGSIDSIDRTLAIDLNAANRNLVLGGDLSYIGGNLTLSLSGNTAVTLPVSGTLATLANSEVLTNKSIDASTNTLTNINNAAISSGAAISYSKLNLSTSILLADINPSFLLPISLGGTNAVTAAAALTNLLPSQTGNAGKVMQTDGTVATWQSVAGSGTVTSVALSLPNIFSVSGSPITSSGTLTGALATQVANKIFAGPSTGADDVPTFRSLVSADLPSISHSNLTNLGADDHTQYHTDARALTWLGTRSTTDLAEGSNLYYTNARFDTQLATKSTTDLTEGSNLYYTTARFNTAFSSKSTTDLTEGTNLYYTAARFNTAFSAKSTTDLVEGSNLYYTDERAQDAVGTALTDTSSVDFTYNDGGNTISAVVIPAGVDHNSLLNFSANKHVDHTAVSISTASNSGLSGGGTIAATRSLVIDPSNAPAVTVATGDLILFADISNSNALANTTAASIAALFAPSVFKSTWLTADGTTKTITHNLGTLDILVQIYDVTTGQTIEIDTTVRTSTSVLTLTASQAPASSWRVLITAI